MFPITKEFQLRFRTEGNDYYEKIQRIIDENTAHIVTACQKYLDDYENNGKPRFSTDLDYLLQTVRRITPDRDKKG
jgi:hypothetical protein